MSEVAAVDLAPILQILLAGAALAAVALGWLRLRARQQSPAHWLRAATLLTLFLTFDLVLFGAFTRLSDSRLRCPTGRSRTTRPGSRWSTATWRPVWAP
jgi:cytochrome c oxidase assembly protein subunit 15